jgi:hypothetical protein
MLLSKKYLQEAKCEVMGLAPVVQLPVSNPVDLEEKEESVISPRPQPTSRQYEPVIAPESLRCPCILQAGGRKGQPCGKPVKANGHCGTHQKKCVESVVVEEMKVEVQPLITVVEPGLCPCVLQAGERKGQLCKKPIKASGHCGTHQKKCVEVLQVEAPISVVLTCGAVFQSGARKGQTCDKPALLNGFCKTHAKKAGVTPALSQTVFASEPETTCPCIIQSGKNRNQKCGRNLVAGQLVCRIHQKTCVQSEPIVPADQPEPIEPRAEYERIAKPVTEPESKQMDIDPAEEGVEHRELDIPLPDPIEQGQWEVVQVTEEELISFLETTPIVDIHTNQLAQLEAQIQQCFSY